MKLLVTLVLLLAPTYACALTNEELTVRCQHEGSAKIAAQAKAWNCEPPEQIRVSHIDNRWWNPSKYVWFTAQINCANDQTTVSKLVQYYRGKCY